MMNTTLQNSGVKIFVQHKNSVEKKVCKKRELLHKRVAEGKFAEARCSALESEAGPGILVSSIPKCISDTKK